MARMISGKPREAKQAVLEAWSTNEQINQFLLKRIPERVWRAEPVGIRPRQGRTIAAIFAHIHHVRLMWLKMCGARGKLPKQLNRRKVTPKQAAAGLKKSARAISSVLSQGLGRKDLRVRGFPPDAVALFAYMVIHEGHHRGQICMLVRQLGARLPGLAGYEMWHWSKRWKEAGFSR